MLNKVNLVLYFPAMSVHSASSWYLWGYNGGAIKKRARFLWGQRSKVEHFSFVYWSYVIEELTHSVSEIWSSMFLVYFVVKSPGYVTHSIWCVLSVYFCPLYRSPSCSVFLSLSIFSIFHFCFSLNIFAVGPVWHSLSALAMLVPWLQGFPMCIYSVFIGAEPCFFYLLINSQHIHHPPIYQTQPWDFRTPQALASVTHSSPDLHACSLSSAPFLQKSQIPKFMSCSFKFFSPTQFLLFLFLSFFYHLFLSVLTHFLGGFSLISQCSHKASMPLRLCVPHCPSVVFHSNNRGGPA